MIREVYHAEYTNGIVDSGVGDEGRSFLHLEKLQVRGLQFPADYLVSDQAYWQGQLYKVNK